MTTVFINDKDALAVWGLRLSAGALAALLAPPPLKDVAADHSRLEHGTRYITTPATARIAERGLLLPVEFTAKSEEEFINKYLSFIAEISRGRFTLHTRQLPQLTFHLIYQSCTEYSHYFGYVAKFILKCVEPNPTHRSHP